MPLFRFASLVEGLQRGADVAIARLMAAGASVGQIRNRVAKMFANPMPAIEEQVRRIAAREVESARSMMRMAADIARPARDAFLQPHLFGDDPNGARTLVGVDFIGPDGKRFLHLGITDDGTRSLQEQLLDAMMEAGDIIGKYPGKFPGIDADDVLDLKTELIYAARKF